MFDLEDKMFDLEDQKFKFEHYVKISNTEYLDMEDNMFRFGRQNI